MNENIIIDKVNKKLSSSMKTKKNQVTLSDVMVYSYPEWEKLTDDVLTREEQILIHQHADSERKQNLLTQSKVLSRSNSQLVSAVKLGIQQSSLRPGFDQLFGNRTNEFVRPGAVSSMFSPAGYLTELYRETRDLHPSSSVYNLDQRRPDLSGLVLSQENMDEEVSTLHLSNELLLRTIQSEKTRSYGEVLSMLALYRQTGGTPFHKPYDIIRQAIILQDKQFSAFAHNPDIARQIDTATLNAIRSNISPELFNILLEEITTDNADALIEKNFGEIDLSAFSRVAFLARFYDMSHDEMRSLLGVVTSQIDFIPGEQYYKNDHITLLSENSGVMNANLLHRRYVENASQFGYAELLPVSENTYFLRFTVRSGHVGSNVRVRIGTAGPGSTQIVRDQHIIPGNNIEVSVPVTLTESALENGVTIGLTRYNGNSSGFQFASVRFNLNRMPFSVWLLKLNKLIRLYRATGLSMENLRAIIDITGPQLSINENTLRQLFWVNQFMQHYVIGRSEAMTLTGAPLSQITYDGQGSDFERLFNMPPLGGENFSPDGTSVNLRPDEVTDTFRTGVLKRAFGVNDAELFTLWCIARGTTTPPFFTCSIENISALYRIALLARVHHLSINDFAMLISVSPYAVTPLSMLSREQMAEVTVLLYLTTQWMQQNRHSVSELYLMTTTRHNTGMTPDIENLIVTLQNGLQNQPPAANEADRFRMAAPLIVAAAQLDSNETAVAILHWINQLRPASLTVVQFLTQVSDYTPEGNHTSLVSFCQRLAQLVLIVRTLGLSADEVSFIAFHPGAIETEATALNNTLLNVRTLSRFHRWLQQCGNAATEILSALRTGTLSPSLLATAMKQDVRIVAQGLAQQNPTATTFSGWRDIDITLQWLDVAGILGITPDGVAALMSLKYQHNNMQSYARWNEISNIMQAGLSEQQTTQLQSSLDKSLSEALSTYAIKNLTPPHVTDREQLYSWLLLDNKVSADVRTTRLAEAIASLQLYVNRGLNGQEEGTIAAVRARRFLMDWDTYNKRYSTWAGISRLVYYPENYLDPTMRIGQTGMMDELLQSLSQSQLTGHSVEDAFKTYMTRFEEVADLEVISGYHDHPTTSDGMTYFIGRQSTTGKYYWRTLDQQKEQEGRFPANAWREWQEIITAAQPLHNQMRPVIFNSRLYVVWLEQREVASADGQTKVITYDLRYAFHRHDGTWSVVTSIPLTDYFSETDIRNLGALYLYCSRSEHSGAMVVMLYSPKATTTENRNTPVLGLLIDTHHVVSRNTASTAYRDHFWQQLDTTGGKKISQPYHERFSSPSSASLNYRWGDDNLTILSGGAVQNIRITDSNDQEVSLLADVNVQVIYSGMAGTRTRLQVDLMRRFGNIGDSFHVYRTLGRNPDHNTSGQIHTPVYRLAGNGNPTGQLLIHRTRGAARLNAWLPHPGISLTSNSLDLQLALPQTRVPDNQFINRYIFINDDSRSATDVSNGYTINTGINPQDVRVEVTSGGSTAIFNARDHIAAADRPALNFNGTIYHFRNLRLTVPRSSFSGGRAQVSFNLTARAVDGRNLGAQAGTLTLTHATGEPAMDILKGTQAEQYLQKGAYRTRLNTLFARSLVARSNQGINAVLSMETQQLEEPMLGEGSYVDVRFSRYDRSLHGDGWFRLLLVGATDTGSSSRSTAVVASGRVSPEEETTIRVFVPFNAGKGYEPNLTYIGVQYSDVSLLDTYKNMQGFEYNHALRRFIAASENSSRTRGLTSSVVNQQSEPMDFRGANAIYFWEMFYYVPMMVFSRLFAESHFTEATQWIKYIWSPEGYQKNGHPAPYQWNVRPLEEDTCWNENPLDSVDPDAVAQADPMHYKVATFMAYLDLLIARGDMAYRKLERDTLNEAKMWYVQALSILGPKPFQPETTHWSNPRLSDAADRTRQIRTQEALLAIREGTVDPQVRTANSLLDLFLPQFNEKLDGYWQLLEQRLFNLRHHLSIDGQPLSLPIYAPPASPNALMSAAVSGIRGGDTLSASQMTIYRFPVMLKNARELTKQLESFGTTLLSLIERQDDSALAVLMHTHALELMLQGIGLQDKTLEEIDADRRALEENLRSSKHKLTHYAKLCEKIIFPGERQSLDLARGSTAVSNAAHVPYTIAAVMDSTPNIFGLSFGGMHLGALAWATGGTLELVAKTMQGVSDSMARSEAYKRRYEEWQLEKDICEFEVSQVKAHLQTLTVRRDAAVMQKNYLEKEYRLSLEQQAFIQNQFSGEALYSWLRGRLSAIYYQFYDLTVSRCLMAQEAYRWATGDSTASFIRPGAWQGTSGGLMAAETLKLNLTQMEQAFIRLDEREKVVTRTVSLVEMFRTLPGNSSFALAEKTAELLKSGQGSAGTSTTGLRISSGQLQAMVRLSDLNIMQDYPSELGSRRRIKQISVSLPEVAKPYQDIRAVLSYGGSVMLPRGCNAQVVSHGTNDNGQFLMHFHDARWLPFEGIPVDDSGTLTLSFQDAVTRQKEIIEKISDIILHIRYTIIS